MLFFAFIVLFLLFVSAAKALGVDYTSEALSDEIVWFDASEAPAALYGVLAPTREDPYYHRVPKRVAETVSKDVVNLSKNTAGGRVRIYTDSPFIAVHAELFDSLVLHNITPLNTSGFGIYTKEKGKKEVYAGFVYVPINCGRAIDASVPLSGREQTVTVAMPLYGCVKTLYIGVKKGSLAVAAPEYKTEKPVVFYGSSITQGGCASRPGNSYQGIMSRSMDMNYINLGFSGSGRGEKTIADYTAGLDMSAFVLDYDHNAPTAEHLQNTHYAFYETVRAAHPDIPIVMVTRPVISPSPDEKERIRIVRASWEKAKKNGDKNVYFIDGSKFMQGYAADAWCVDGTHPNDFGFVLMAKAMEKVLKPLL